MYCITMCFAKLCLILEWHSLLDRPYANTVLNTGVRSHLQQSKYPHACHKVQCKLKRKMSSHSWKNSLPIRSTRIIWKFLHFSENKEWHTYKLCWFTISQIELQNYIQNKIYFCILTKTIHSWWHYINVNFGGGLNVCLFYNKIFENV